MNQLNNINIKNIYYFIFSFKKKYQILLLLFNNIIIPQLMP